MGPVGAVDLCAEQIDFDMRTAPERGHYTVDVRRDYHNKGWEKCGQLVVDVDCSYVV